MAPSADRSSADVRAQLDALVRDALAVAPPAGDLTVWRGRAEEEYGRAVAHLRAAIDRAVEALRAARAAA